MRRLTIDIETAPNLAYVWNLFKTNVGLNQLVEHTDMLCFAAKWYGEDEVIFASQWDQGKDDMVALAWELLDEADAIIGWHSAGFDLKHLNREFLEAGLQPPSPWKNIDLYQTVKKQFFFSSNKLDHVAGQLGLGNKEDTGGFDLWAGVMRGEPEARAKMESYNIQDCILTESVYDALIPWIKSHPNWALYVDTDRPVCQNCGSEHVTKKGYGYTNTFAYQRYKCQDCGHNMRGRTNVMSKEQRANVLVAEV